MFQVAGKNLMVVTGVCFRLHGGARSCYLLFIFRAKINAGGVQVRKPPLWFLLVILVQRIGKFTCTKTPAI